MPSRFLSSDRRTLWVFAAGFAFCAVTLLVLAQITPLRTWAKKEAKKHLLMFQRQTPKSYDRPIDPDLLSAFGTPDTLGKSGYIYHTDPNSAFLETGEISTYHWGQSIEGMIGYMTGAAQEAYRDSLHNVHKRSVKAVLEANTGIDRVPLGSIDSAEKVLVSGDSGDQIFDVTLRFSTGAVAQFLLGVPAPENRVNKLILAIHGCSSSPDKVMGTTQEDYTNAFGRRALEAGYTVAAPYILNECDWIDDFDVLGALSSGTTTFGYEIMKIRAIKDFVRSENSDLIDNYIWGISFGGQLSMYTGAVDTTFSKVVIAGSLFDHRAFRRNKILPLNNQKHQRASDTANLRRYLNTEDIICSILPRTVILPIGSFDLQLGLLDLMREARAYTDSVYGNEDVLKVNFFRGYHETNPERTLELLSEESPEGEA